MPKFLITREVPGAGQMSADALQALSQRSCGVLRELGPQIQWVQSYVSADHIHCVYIAPDADAVREHARRGDFPANGVDAIVATIDPTTAEGVRAEGAGALQRS
jgi:hypothetical protein